MLANPQQHHPTIPYSLNSQYFRELQSPSSSNLPFYFGDSFSISSPSPSDLDHPKSQRAYGQTASIQALAEHFENPSLMPSNPYTSTQTPPIRVFQSSPALQLSEASLSQHEWQSDGEGSQMWQDNRNAQLRRSGNSKHQRGNSGSSIGSGGPSSPYTQSTSHPQIANTESSPSGLQAYPQYDFADQADGMPYAKSSRDSHDSFLAPEFQNFNPTMHDTESNIAAKIAMMRALKVHQRDDSPAPTFSASSRGYPSPKTPRTIYDGEPSDATANGFNTGMSIVNGVDSFGDETYTTSFSAASIPAHKTPQMGSMLSPYRSLYNDRVQAANSGQLQIGSQSPASSISRDRSPYRSQDSPFALHADGFTSAAQLREQQKAERDAIAIQQHRFRPNSYPSKTVSPKDVTLEFNEPEVDMKTPLFPAEEHMDSQMQDFNSVTGQQSASSYSFAAATIPGNVQVPQQYPFIATQQSQPSIASPGSVTPDFPARLTSMETTISEGAYDGASEHSKLSNTAADSGTYTCTYHGCTLRFETPAKLQKHKREGHRQQTPNASTGTNQAGLLRNSQAGPHKCERLNPQTKKPCNTIFSRPYDLTRHEDTIHNGRKQKVRCQYCAEEKTFSRNDALTRHMRVVHPEIDFPGKIRKRHE